MAVPSAFDIDPHASVPSKQSVQTTKLKRRHDIKLAERNKMHEAAALQSKVSSQEVAMVMQDFLGDTFLNDTSDSSDYDDDEVLTRDLANPTRVRRETYIDLKKTLHKTLKENRRSKARQEYNKCCEDIVPVWVRNQPRAQACIVEKQITTGQLLCDPQQRVANEALRLTIVELEHNDCTQKTKDILPDVRSTLREKVREIQAKQALSDGANGGHEDGGSDDHNSDDHYSDREVTDPEDPDDTDEPAPVRPSKQKAKPTARKKGSARRKGRGRKNKAKKGKGKAGKQGATEVPTRRRRQKPGSKCWLY